MQEPLSNVCGEGSIYIAVLKCIVFIVREATCAHGVICYMKVSRGVLLHGPPMSPVAFYLVSSLYIAFKRCALQMQLSVVQCGFTWLCCPSRLLLGLGSVQRSESVEQCCNCCGSTWCIVQCLQVGRGSCQPAAQLRTLCQAASGIIAVWFNRCHLLLDCWLLKVWGWSRLSSMPWSRQ